MLLLGVEAILCNYKVGTHFLASINQSVGQ